MASQLSAHHFYLSYCPFMKPFRLTSYSQCATAQFQPTKLCGFLKQASMEGSPAFASSHDVQYINRTLPNSCFKINLFRSHYLANCCGLYSSRVLFGRERLMEDISFVLISFANCCVERWYVNTSSLPAR